MSSGYGKVNFDPTDSISGIFDRMPEGSELDGWDIKGTLYLPVKATAAVVANNVIIVDPITLTTSSEITTTNTTGKIFLLGFPTFAVAINKFFWVPIGGRLTVPVTGATAIDVPLYTTATSGKLSATATSSWRIINLKLTTAAAGAGNAAGYSTGKVHVLGQ
jgi:hypothetical protein